MGWVTSSVTGEPMVGSLSIMSWLDAAIASLVVSVARPETTLSLELSAMLAASIVAVFAVYFIEKKIPYIPLVGGIIISLFGSLTLYFNNPVFLYMKPTIVNVIFGYQ